MQSIVAELILGPDGKAGNDSNSAEKKEKNAASWQADGWVRWLEGLRGQYERRMQTMCKILEEGKDLVQTTTTTSPTPTANDKDNDNDYTHLTLTPLYTFDYPLGGMFIWLRMSLESHPLYHLYSSTDPTSPRHPSKLAEALWIHLTTAPYLVLVCPGWIFAADESIREEKAWRFFRICFAAVDEGEVEGGAKKFVEGVRRFWEVDEVRGAEGLLARGEGGEGMGMGIGGIGEMGEGMVDLGGVC